MSQLSYHIHDNGDSALTIIFEEQSGELLTRKIISIEGLIKSSIGDGLLDIIPAYQSITILFDLLVMNKEIIKNKLKKILNTPIKASTYQSNLIEIPVCYDLELAPDLADLAEHCQLSEQQVIARHTSPTYLVHMLGFLPGFLYLGGLDPQLYCPRKKTPASRIPAGSVAIGGNQTGIYPVESPGGWHIIGRTPLRLFEPTKNNPALASPLDKIEFVSIEHLEFLEIQSKNKVMNS